MANVTANVTSISTTSPERLYTKYTRKELLLDDVEILVHYSMVVIYGIVVSMEIEKFVFVLCWEDKINLKGQRSEYRWPVDETYIILHLRWIQFHLGWVMVVNFLG